MKNVIKKFLVVVVAVVTAVFGGGIFILLGNMDAINDIIVKTVKDTTGKEFRLEKTSLSFYPNIGLNLTNGAWGTADVDDISVKFGLVNVEVQLLPLFSKEIKIEAVRLISPEINYNATLTKPKVEEPTEVVEAKPTVDNATATDPMAILDTLLLKEFAIENAKIVYTDAAQTATLNDFNINVSNFAFGSDVPFSFSSAIAYDGAISTAITTSLSGSMNIGDTSYKLANLKGSIDDINYSGHLNLDMPKGAPMVVDTEFAFDNINVNNYFPFKTNEAKATTPVVEETATTAEKAPLVLPTVNAKLSFGKLTYDIYNISDFSMNVNTNSTKVQVSELKGKLDDTNFNMVADVNMPTNAPMEIDTKISIDDINVDKYMPKPSTTETVATETTTEAPATAEKKAFSLPTVNAEIAIGKLTYDKYNLANFIFKVKTMGTSVTVSELKGKFDETTFDIFAHVEMPANKPMQIDTKVSIDKIDVNKYMPPKSAEAAAPTTSEEKATAPKASASPISLPTVTADISAGQVLYDFYDVKHITATIKTAGDVVEITPAKFNIYDSNMSIKTKSHLNTMYHIVEANMQNINIGDVLKDFTGKDQVLGRLNIDTELSFKGMDKDSIIKTFNTDTSITGNLEVDGKVIPPIATKILESKNLDFSKVNFTKTAIDIVGINGKLNFTTLDLYSAIVDIDGNGTVNLNNNEVDLVLNTKIGETNLPLAVGGTFSKLTYGLHEEPIKNAVKETLQETKDEVEYELKKQAEEILKGKDVNESIDDLKDIGEQLLQDKGKGFLDKLPF